MTDVSEFETQVMHKLLEYNDSVFNILREQFKVAKVIDRQLTGVGFFLEFYLPADAAIIPAGLSFEINDVVAEIDELKNGAGFVLYVKNGRLATLEGFTFDENWPYVISGYQLLYREKSRNISF
jgi:hypothetical protein